MEINRLIKKTKKSAFEDLENQTFLSNKNLNEVRTDFFLKKISQIIAIITEASK